MSVIVKGMEMPQNCESCPMCHRRFDGYRQETRLACYAVEDWAEEEEGRRDDCPLIQLPPHSDLVDRDELLAEYDRQHEGEAGKARKIMEQAKAVIEAEGSEE